MIINTLKRIKKSFIILAFCFLFSCTKDGSKAIELEDLFNGNVISYQALPVEKNNSKRIYVHFMPWFETKETNSGAWGIHWTMSNKNPDKIDANGYREIASHFYPLTGPYASSDPDIIEYQLLLMKLSGIDAVLIDWPGIQNKNDLPQLVNNTNKIVELIGKVGLKFAIVYEDWPLSYLDTEKIFQAQEDMKYIETNYFKNKSYEYLDGKPILLVFGPQQLQKESEWTSVFSIFDLKPSFFTLWYQSSEAGKNAVGEFSWVYKDHLADLQNFYGNNFNGKKIASAYPGFKTFYAEGNWVGPTWVIEHLKTLTFLQTLDLALQGSSPSVQLVTWNDYGEGTMIEPTREFSYSLLSFLQLRLGVNNISDKELQLVIDLFFKRKKYKNDANAQDKMNQVFYYIVSLQMGKARLLFERI